MNDFVLLMLGIGVAVAGGLIGLRALLYISVAGVAGYASVASNAAFFASLTEQFGHAVSPTNAGVISFMILTLLPLISIGYLGRKMIVRLNVAEIHKVVDAILGTGYMLAIYIAVICIV